MQRLLIVVTLLSIFISVAVPVRSQDLYVVNYGSPDIIRIFPTGKKSIFTHIKDAIPSCLTSGPAGRLYVAVNNVSPKHPEGRILTFTANAVQIGSISSGISFVTALTADQQGNLFVGGYGDIQPKTLPPDNFGQDHIGYVKEITADKNVRTVARIPYALMADLAVNDEGTVFIADGANATVFKITPAGKQSIFKKMDEGQPSGLAIDKVGNLYVCLSRPNSIRKYSPSGVGTVFAKANLNIPAKATFAASGNLYVANADDNTIEEFTPDGTGTTFVDKGLNEPSSVAFSPPTK